MKECPTEAQVAAIGILSQNDFGDYKTYKVACACGCDHHIGDVVISADERGISMTQSTTVSTAYWHQYCKINYTECWPLINAKYFVNAAINRIALVWQVLFKGNITMTGDIVMTQQQTINYANTLTHAMADVEQFRQARINNMQEKVLVCHCILILTVTLNNGHVVKSYDVNLNMQKSCANSDFNNCITKKFKKKKKVVIKTRCSRVSNRSASGILAVEFERDK